MHVLSVEVVGLIACTKYGRAEGRFARVYFRSIVHLCAADGNEGVLHAVMSVLYSICINPACTSNPGQKSWFSKPSIY